MKNKILLIDDDSSTRESLVNSLEAEHYRVFPAATRQKALDSYGEERVDLLVVSLDCGTERFRAADVNWLATIDNRMPVIILTKDSTLGAEAQSAAGDFLMERPLDFTMLLAKIGGLIDEPAATRQIRRAMRHALVLPFAAVRDGEFRKLLQARSAIPFFCDVSNIELPDAAPGGDETRPAK